MTLQATKHRPTEFFAHAATRSRRRRLPSGCLLKYSSSTSSLTSRSDGDAAQTGQRQPATTSPVLVYYRPVPQPSPPQLHSSPTPIDRSQAISGSETLVSKSGVFELGFFAPRGYVEHYLGVRYKNLIESGPTFWVGLENKIPITNFLDATLYIEAGKLHIKELGSVLWSSNSIRNASATAVAILIDTGNFVVRDQLNHSMIFWQTFDYPGDALLPGARLGLDAITGANIFLTLYDPPYNCTLRIDQSKKRGFAIYIDGHDYLGTFPDWIVTYQESDTSLQLNVPKRPSDIEYLQLKLGQVSLLRWLGNASAWQPLWSYPSSCNVSAFFCGNFGACTRAGKCACIDGFRPSFAEDWELGRFSSGCSRIAPLNCESGAPTDSFVVLDNLQGLPDNPQDEMAASSEECKASCLSKCYCVAYSYSSGCKIWHYKLVNLSFSDDPPYIKIYVRVGSKREKGMHTRDIVALVIGLVAITVIGSLLFWLYKRSSSRYMKVEGFLVVYSYAQLKKATRNFSDKIGEGGFGSVFKGMTAGSTLVAVKKLKGLGYGDKQFRTEVQTIGMIQHTNLVRLLGFCAEGARRLLVYEYMPNGSLDTHLFSENSNALSWNLRYQIALGIAKGLAYLHEECNECIIHCDIKPENILLDAEFCPKIADFGMAKLLGREFNAALTTIRGTIGYLAPEWIFGQAVTRKADVYSFGIVLFEIISGRKTTKKMRFGNHSYFPSYAAVQVNAGEVLCLLDGRLEGIADVKELDVACRVACWCIQDDENHRPSMGQVVRMLEAVVDTAMPPIPASFQNLVDSDDSGIYSAERSVFRT